MAILVFSFLQIEGEVQLSMQSLVVQLGVLHGLWYISACRVSWCSWGYWVVFGISQHADSHGAPVGVQEPSGGGCGFKQSVVFLSRTGQQSDVRKGVSGFARLNV